MPELVLKSFAYTALNPAGERVRDVMQAVSETDVVTALHRAGLTPVDVRPSGNFAASRLTELWAKLNGKEARFKVQELSSFTRQLHQMLRSGISISAALSALADDQPNAMIADMLRDIAERLTSGASLSQAFDGYPRAFDSIFLAYMAAAEESGNLVGVTERLTAILDKRAEIQRKVKGVTMYPLLVSIAVGVMLGAIILFLVPRYAGIYASFDAELPAPTRLLISLSKVFPVFAVIGGVGLAGFVAWNRAQIDNLEFGTRYDKAKYRIPVLGPLAHKLALMRFCSTAGGGLLAGIQSHDAFELGGRASGSRWVRATVPDMQDAVRAGRPLSSALAEHGELFPANLRTMVATGEDTGELGVMLEHTGSAIEDEIDVLVATMSAKLEVALLLFMGLSVGAVLVALYLPILNLTSTISKGYGL